jgi:hypothetical protein
LYSIGAEIHFEDIKYGYFLQPYIKVREYGKMLTLRGEPFYPDRTQLRNLINDKGYIPNSTLDNLFREMSTSLI